MSNITMLKARGLHTFNNYLSEIPEGALIDAINVNIDRDGVVEPRRGITQYGSIGSSSSRTKQLLLYKDRVLAHYGSTIAYDNGSGTFSNFSGTFSELETDLRIKYLEQNGNLYVTTTEGIQKISASSAANLGSAVISRAGVPKALNVTATFQTSTATDFLAAYSVVGYRTTWAITDSNGNTIESSPSERAVVYNYSSEGGGVHLSFPVPNEITTSHIYRIYRTNIKTASGAPPSPDDISALDPGDEHQLIYEAVYASGTTIEVDDIVPEAFRDGGAYLYTNQYSGLGLTQANSRPPIATDIAAYKNCLFLANTKTEHLLNEALLGVDYFHTGLSITSILAGVVTTTSPHSLSTGTYIAIAGNGNSSLNGIWEVTVTGASTFTISSAASTTGQQGKVFKSHLKITKNINIAITSILTGVVTTAENHGLHTGDYITITGNGNGLLNSTWIITVTGVNTFTILSGASTIGAQGAITATTDRYFFVGDRQQSTITFAAESAGNYTGKYFTFNTAEDKYKYYIWYTLSGVGTDPAPTGRTGIVVDIIAADSAATVAAKTIAALEAVTLDVTLTATTFNCENNGKVSDWFGYDDTPITNTVTTSGYGEDTTKGLIRISNLATVSLKIADTTSSIVNVINRDATATVYVYDVSTPDSTPGNIVFESRELDDIDFTVQCIQEGTIANTMFNPDLITAKTSSNTEAVNRIYYSRADEPEHIPDLNWINIGPKDKAILRILGLRDSLFILKEEGVYRLTGDGPTNFSVALFDNSANLIAADTACILNNQIYALTSQGVATISETGVSIISRPIENVFNKLNTDDYVAYNLKHFAASYEADRSYLLWIVNTLDDMGAVDTLRCYRFNTFTRTWTSWDREAACAVVNPANNKLYTGANDINYVEVERKALSRTDYADRQYSISLPSNPYNSIDNYLLVSDTTEMEDGDILVQTQYLTKTAIVALARKLYLDPGFSTNKSFYQNFDLTIGDTLATKMIELVTQINIDLGTAYSTSFSSSFATIQTEFNSLITNLNSNPTLFYDTYQQSTGTVDREILISNVLTSKSAIESDTFPPIFTGPITLHKGIRSKVTWAPISFGDPSLLKHVRESTVIFEDTTGAKCTIGYNTDLSGNFEDIDFNLESSGVWGSFSWGGSTWGGIGNPRPFRTLIPRQKQRCRFIRARFTHNNAYYKYALYGISYVFEVTSTRAYK